MASLKGALIELKEVINNVISRKIDFTSRITNEFDFKKREREYYAKEVDSAIKKLEAVLSESFVIADSRDKMPLTKAANRIRDLKSLINTRKFLQAIVMIEEIFDMVPSLAVSDADIPKSEFFLPRIPRDIYAEIKTSFDELIKCYEHNCLRSALIICGRILEVALHKRYFDLTGIDLLEKSPDIGLGNLVLKFKQKQIPFDPGLSNQIHLINHLRVASVHKKKQVFKPSVSQTKASILYTLDILKKLFNN